MANSRILSIDVLRGMTIALMIIVNTPGSWSYIYAPFKHAQWHGCTPTDLVFPSFLFVVGISMSISFQKSLNRHQQIIKIAKRAALIFLIGLLLNWFPFVGRSLENLRIFGVLQRIACSFFVAGLVIIFIKNLKLLGVVSILLMGLHWWILTAFGGDDPFSLKGNISGLIDISLLGEAHIYKGFGIAFDPEGILGVMSSAAHVIIGYISAKIVLGKTKLDYKFCIQMTAMGLLFIFVSWLLCHLIPINKPLWTPSYVMHTIGYLYIIWAVLIFVVDILKWENWTYPFNVFGRNPLISFILSILMVKTMIYLIKFNKTNLYVWTYENIFRELFDDYFGSLMFAVSFTIIVWLFAWWLYKKGKVIKV